MNPRIERCLRVTKQLPPGSGPLTRRGRVSWGGIKEPAPLSPSEVKRLMDEGAVVVDTRPGLGFAACHIPGSYSVPLREGFAEWVARVVPPGRPLVIVSTGRQTHHEIARQLVATGYGSLAGFLEGGISAWGAEAGFPVALMEVLSVSELKGRLQSPGPPLVLDVRLDAEWDQGHIPGALHIEAGSLRQEADNLPADRAIAAYSATNNRSATALSILEQRGFRDLQLLQGGWSAWENARYRVEKRGKRRPTKNTTKE